MDNADKYDFYRVSRFLNQPRRVMGCTTDELIPGLVLLMTGMCTCWLFTALLVMGSWLFVIKYLKRKYGSAFLLVNLYWHTSQPVSKNALPNTPPSEYKHWRS